MAGVLRDGPIPVLIHGAIEYVAGVVLIIAPLLINYNGTATAISLILGFVVLGVAATTDGPTGLTSQIPITVHVVLDYLLAAFLVASPFLFGFSGEGAPTAIFVILGVAHLLITIGTRFSDGPARAIDPRP